MLANDVPQQNKEGLESKEPALSVAKAKLNAFWEAAKRDRQSEVEQGRLEKARWAVRRPEQNDLPKKTPPLKRSFGLGHVLVLIEWFRSKLEGGWIEPDQVSSQETAPRRRPEQTAVDE